MHVRDVGLKGESDHQIWDFAAKNGFAITTKDDDFRSLSLLRGAPSKVIWLVVGNTSTGEILRIFLDQLHAIEAFINESSTALLALNLASGSRKTTRAAPIMARHQWRCCWVMVFASRSWGATRA